MTRSARIARRRGGVYPLVLIVSATASAAVLTGLAIRQDHDQQRADTKSLADARLLARAGLDAAMQTLSENPDWRDRIALRAGWKIAAPGGTVTIMLVDPDDGDLTDDPAETVRISATGASGPAETTLRVDAQPVTETTRQRTLDMGPIRFWPLDETSGYVAADLTGRRDISHAQPGYLNKRAGPDDGPAPLMTTTATYGWGLHSSDLLLSKGTVMCWVYCDGNTAGDQTIFAKTDNDGNEGDFVLDLAGDTLVIRARLTNRKGVAETLSLGPITPGVWTHVAVTFGAQFRGYVDGKDAGTPIASATSWVNNNDLIYIGAGYGTLLVRDTPLNGSVRDVVIFDLQLSAGEVNAMVTSAPTGLAIVADSWDWEVE